MESKPADTNGTCVPPVCLCNCFVFVYQGMKETTRMSLFSTNIATKWIMFCSWSFLKTLPCALNVCSGMTENKPLAKVFPNTGLTTGRPLAQNPPRTFTPFQDVCSYQPTGFSNQIYARCTIHSDEWMGKSVGQDIFQHDRYVSLLSSNSSLITHASTSFNSRKYAVCSM